MLRTAMLVLACLSVGCLSPLPALNTLSDLSLRVRGSGAVFPTIEEASLDALASCYLAARRDGGLARVRAGVIRPVEGGFSYGRIWRATRVAPETVTFPLPPDAVAHFRHYPATGDLGTDHRNRMHSTQGRHVVDEVDPLHRPSFLLNPRLDVRVYSGESDLTLANLRTWNGGEPRLAAVGRSPR